MKSIFASSNVVVYKFITLSLLCAGVGACAPDPDSAAVEGNTDTVGVATEDLVTQTLIQLHGSEPPTFQVRTVTRAQQNAQLAEREQSLQSAAASKPAPSEGQERIGTAQEAIGIVSGYPTTAVWLNDDTYFNGSHTLVISGSGTIDLDWICRSTGQFALFTGFGTCGTNDAWGGRVRSYSSNNNTGFLSGECNYNSYVFSGTAPGCSVFAVNTAHNTLATCESGSSKLTIATSFYLCGTENTGGH